MSDSTESTSAIFVCPYCDKRLKFRTGQMGLSYGCPNCKRNVVLLENYSKPIGDNPKSTWFYQRYRFLSGNEDVGPVHDEEFSYLIDSKQVNQDTFVMSPEITLGNWVKLMQVKMEVVRERIDQRRAEAAKAERLAARRRQVDAENRAKLRVGIRSILETGSLSTSHRRAIEKFAVEAGIPQGEVEECIARESATLVREVFDEALTDGILDPAEEQKIGQLATALNVELTLTPDDIRRISVCRLAYELSSGTYQPRLITTVPFKLAAKEVIVEHARVKWYEIAQLKRPAGIPLGDDHYLRLLGEGEAYLTTKQFTMIAAMKSEKVTLSSVQRVTRFTDGFLLNRSTGKSAFIELLSDDERACRLSLLTEHACSGTPVLGTEPAKAFIPQTALQTQPPERYGPARLNTEPRYTFRVVGDFVGERASYIRSLRLADPIILLREPSNPADPNAVAVYDQHRRQLGYLKREVASWFAHIMTERAVGAKVHAITETGSLMVGVYV